MRRMIFPFAAFLFVAALPAAAQIKQPRAKNPDDEGLHYVVLREFARMSEALNQLNSKLLLLEGEVKELRQQSAKVSAEMATLQTSAKDSTAKVGEMQLSSERNLLALNRDLVQVRSDLATLIDMVKRSQVTLGPALVAPDMGGSKVEGYIMEVSEREVKISLGSAQGAMKGWRLGVFAAADPKTQIGQLVVTDVIDANNSKAEIILMSPGARFQFSDIVRPIT